MSMENSWNTIAAKTTYLIFILLTLYIDAQSLASGVFELWTLKNSTWYAGMWVWSHKMYEDFIIKGIMILSAI